MYARVYNCMFENVFNTPLLIDKEISVNVSESLFVKCYSEENGGVICTQSLCQNVFISKVCSNGCNTTQNGQFLFAYINKNYYDVVISFFTLANTQSTGNSGVCFVGKSLKITDTNFSNSVCNKFPSFVCDHTKDGCSITYSEVVGNTCTSRSILSLQEIDTTCQNLLSHSNVLNNTGTQNIGVILVVKNQNTYIKNCNVYQNNGDGYLVYNDDSHITIEDCYFQETYNNSSEKICNVKINSTFISSIEIRIDAPMIGDCVLMNRFEIYSKFIFFQNSIV